ncbi:MAG TPA: hypothetical protein VF664_06070 [Cystobacter sp.]
MVSLPPIRRVRYVASDAKERLGLSALLVRPDGFVAWASDTAPSPEAVTRAASASGEGVRRFVGDEMSERVL